MRRIGRRQGGNYLEENEELYQEFNNEETAEEYSEYIEFDADEFQDDLDEEENSPSTAIVVWKAIGKVAVVILALIALFFISMEVTKIWLDRNQEPSTYSNDAPIYDDSDIGDPDVTIDDTEDEEPAEPEDEDDEYEPSSKPSTDKPSTDKPSTDKPSTDKPSTDNPSTDKPSTDKPSTDKPSTPAEPSEPSTPSEPSKPEPSTPSTPSKPSKPIIVPGNPAA